MEIDLLTKINDAKNMKLYELQLNNQGIKLLPKEIGELEDLISLDLRQNNIKELPQSFANLKKLERLHLRENSFDEFPEVLLSLTNLKHLCLSNNNICKIPEGINSLKQLVDFQIADNKLKAIPETIIELTDLDHLCLNNNEIESIPKNIDKLIKITKLHLQHNKLYHLPFNLNNADYIRHINLEENPLIDPPLAIITKGQGAILSYLLEKERGRIFKIPIDNNFKTALKQYLVFFNDFVSVTKGININFEVTTYEEGIELNFKLNSEQELIEVKNYLDEYINFTRANIDNLKPEFKTNINEFQKDILIADLKNQIRSMQSSLEIRSLEIRMLNKQVEQFYNLLSLEKQFPNPVIIQNDIKTIAQSFSKTDIVIDIKNELPNLQRDLNDLKKLLNKIDDNATLSEIETIDAEILAIEECEPDASKIDKVPFKKLKRVLDEINNEDSILGKAVRATEKAIEAAKKLAGTYNKFAQWLALPVVPDIFVK